jgi:hypothetical protein
MTKKTFYTLIISIILALASISGYCFAVVYVGGMGGDLVSIYKKSNDLKKEEDSLNSIKRVAQNADARNADLMKYIVPVDNEGSIKFVQTIEDLATLNNLTFSTNAIEIVQDGNLSKFNKEYLSIKESISGTKLSVSNFVDKVESLPFNIKIKSYSTAKVGGLQTATSSQQLDLQILVVKEK